MSFFGRKSYFRNAHMRKFLLFAFSGFALYIAILFFVVPARSSHYTPITFVESAVAFRKQEEQQFGAPIRINIPAIRVDALIEHMGLTPQGMVGVPKGPTNTAWFTGSATPGEHGTALIVGHFGWKNGIHAVFDNLSKLKKGDKIYVASDNGVMRTFVIRALKTYKKNEDSSIVFGVSDGGAHLNLITCSGVWDKVSKNYSTRLVVFADREVAL